MPRLELDAGFQKSWGERNANSSLVNHVQFSNVSKQKLLSVCLLSFLAFHKIFDAFLKET